jgi:hypothetical protein
MAANNLRIIYDNVADSATLTASTTASGLTVNNLKTEQKGFVWRSTGTSATITATWSSAQTISGVVLPFCNLTSNATIQVRLFTNTGDATPVLNTGAQSARAYTPQDVFGGFTQPAGVNAYSFGGGSYARSWFAATVARKIEVIINDAGNSSGYIELSRLVCGNYWSPTYNTEFGLSLGYRDTSEQTRSESGNLITTNNTVHRTLNFNLNWLVDTDRTRMLSILRGNGLRKPLFVSIFPEDASLTKEQEFQIYGKLVNTNSITHPVYSVYTTTVDIEEI